ncbi:MAG: hypothetical protein V1816_12720 [Pseudomonadota bacterium]
MQIVFYSAAPGETTDKLKKLVAPLVPKEKMEIAHGLGNLSRILRRPRVEQTVAILLATTYQELVDLKDLSELLSFVRLIVVAPDEKKETVDMAYQLHPRFLSFCDSDFSDVAGVVGKMINSRSGWELGLGEKTI